MSGGAWGYQSHQLEDAADQFQKLLRVVAQTERLLDWSECGDTARADAERELYDLWVTTFNEVYPR